MGRQSLQQRLADIRAVVGTLAHNRSFSAQEIREYTRFDRHLDGEAVIRWLLAQGYVTRLSRGQYVPTVAGWRWIEERD